jgi:hypothetical protein
VRARLDETDGPAAAADLTKAWIAYFEQSYRACATELTANDRPTLQTKLDAFLQDLGPMWTALHAVADQHIKNIVAESNRAMSAFNTEMQQAQLKAGAQTVKAAQQLNDHDSNVWEGVRKFQQRTDQMWRDIFLRRR